MPSKVLPSKISSARSVTFLGVALLLMSSVVDSSSSASTSPKISIGDRSVVEGNDVVRVHVPVNLSRAAARKVEVTFGTSEGSATASEDFRPKTGVLKFEPGQTLKKIKIAILPDSLDEAQESFFVELSDSVRATIRDRKGKITIRDPNCYEKMNALGIVYTKGPQTVGVAKPVTVDMPLNGLAYFSQNGTQARSEFFMDCSLAIALNDAAEVLKPLGVTEVGDLGIYNYRCIGGTGEPPNCTLSQHAHATAIDIAELRTESADTYNVNDDWVIDAEEDTCAAETSNDKDALLHDVVCAWHDQNIFNIILTPNYNADHRNHIHADLTPGDNYIQKAETGGASEF